jgi:hypothetical protein
MKKLNTTYLDNIVSKILKETLEERADTLVSKIKGDVCECGGQMYEGECNECGNMYEDMSEGIYNVEDIDDSNEFDYVQEDMVLGDSDKEELDSNNSEACKYHMDNFGPEDERTLKFCGSNMNESLKGRNRRQGRKSETDEGNAFTGALSQARKTGDKNFEVGGKKFETKEGRKSETDEGNAFTGALSKARKSGDDNFEVDGKKFETKESKKTDNSLKRYCGGEITKPCIDRASKSGSSSLVKKANLAEPKKKIKESYRLTESEMVSMIEKIVLERKNKEVKDSAEKNNIKGMGGSPRGLEVYKKAHNGSGKENDDYIKSVTKKMKEYLKDGSKGDYDMNPKTFPVGNGELEEMDKKAFQITDDLEDFNYEIAGLQLPTPDAIEFNEDFMEKLYKGHSTTGNAPGGNALESKTNDRFNKIRKKNTLKKLKDQSYNRVSQPVYNEKSGTDKGKGLNIKLESIEDKKQKQINEEFDRIKSLMGYNQKTQ